MTGKPQKIDFNTSSKSRMHQQIREEKQRDLGLLPKHPSNQPTEIHHMEGKPKKVTFGNSSKSRMHEEIYNHKLHQIGIH